MERKIGEIFEIDGEWYQTVPDDGGIANCNGCDLKELGTCDKCSAIRGECIKYYRNDREGVIFKRLEKYGGFIKDNIRGEIRQPYTIFDIDRANSRDDRVQFSENKDNFVFVVTKQTKEDMKEKKLNLKPFDIQKAREGKPVCTRDGRKARIICYDRQSDHGFPIVALVENTGAEKDEDIRCYRLNGATAEPSYDLMMSPERHEGWVNVFNHGNNDTYVGNIIFPTEKLAKEAASRMNGVKYIATVKIEWEG